MSDFALDGKMAVVTGAARGIGRSIAERFADLSANADEALVRENLLSAVRVTRATLPRLAAYADAGVDRVIVSPWRRSAEAVDGLRRYAEEVL